MIDKHYHYLCSCGKRLYTYGLHFKNGSVVVEFECECGLEWFGCAFIEPTELEPLTEQLKRDEV